MKEDRWRMDMRNEVRKLEVKGWMEKEREEG